MSEDYHGLKSFLASVFEQYFIDYGKLDQGSDEGYTSELLLLTLVHKKSSEEVHIVIKQPTVYEDGTIAHHTDPHFQKEIRFYQSLWPTLKQYFEKKSSKAITFMPKCYGTSTNGIYRIAMENLVKSGYIPFDRTKDMDEEHLEKVFETYGIFHGISMAFRINNNEEYNILTENLTSRWILLFTGGTIVSEMSRTVATYLKQYFDPSTEKMAIEKLEMYSNEGPKMIRECVDYTGSNAVVLHGDCWVNNLMFKYDDNGKLEGVKLIDFQLTTCGTPVYDLSYCLYSSGTSDSFDNLENLLKIYYRSLFKTLNVFDLDADQHYSFNTLKKEWAEYCKFGFAMTLFLSRLKLVDEKDRPDVRNYDGGLLEPFKIPPEKEEGYKRSMRKLVIHMCNNNFL